MQVARPSQPHIPAVEYAIAKVKNTKQKNETRNMQEQEIQRIMVVLKDRIIANADLHVCNARGLSIEILRDLQVLQNLIAQHAFPLQGSPAKCRSGFGLHVPMSCSHSPGGPLQGDAARVAWRQAAEPSPRQLCRQLVSATALTIPMSHTPGFVMIHALAVLMLP